MERDYVGAVLGCDFVGEVVVLGNDAKRLAKGDVIAVQYLHSALQGELKVPSNISREKASTVPLTAATSWLAHFSKGCLNLDRNQAKGTKVLIWGGSSSVALYAIQMASMFGLEVVTTCSPKHADLVRSYGAKYVFYYKDGKVVNKIQRATLDLAYAFDAIGNPTSSAIVSQCFGGKAGNLFTVRPS